MPSLTVTGSDRAGRSRAPPPLRCSRAGGRGKQPVPEAKDLGRVEGWQRLRGAHRHEMSDPGEIGRDLLFESHRLELLPEELDAGEVDPVEVLPSDRITRGPASDGVLRVGSSALGGQDIGQHVPQPGSPAAPGAAFARSMKSWFSRSSK
jgi:hypothetical protein